MKTIKQYFWKLKQLFDKNLQKALGRAGNMRMNHSLANEKCVNKILEATLSPLQILGGLVKTNLEV